MRNARRSKAAIAREKVIENIEDVIIICIEELKEKKEKINLKYPDVIGIKNLEIAV